MEIKDSLIKKVILTLAKDFSRLHTVTTLANGLKYSRVGIWKVLKKLCAKEYINMISCGAGRTNSYIIKINWENPLVEKILAFYLTEEAVKQKRWIINFKELDDKLDFCILYGSILYSSKKANDIDLIGITKKSKFMKIDLIMQKIQKTQIKKIHSINFTQKEFQEELKKSNKAFINAIKGGIILFGQEDFVKFISTLP